MRALRQAIRTGEFMDDTDSVQSLISSVVSHEYEDT
jgi:hypothetical protein